MSTCGCELDFPRYRDGVRQRRFPAIGRDLPCRSPTKSLEPRITRMARIRNAFIRIIRAIRGSFFSRAAPPAGTPPPNHRANGCRLLQTMRLRSPGHAGSLSGMRLRGGLMALIHCGHPDPADGILGRFIKTVHHGAHREHGGRVAFSVFSVCSVVNLLPHWRGSAGDGREALPVIPLPPAVLHRLGRHRCIWRRVLRSRLCLGWRFGLRARGVWRLGRGDRGCWRLAGGFWGFCL